METVKTNYEEKLVKYVHELREAEADARPAVIGKITNMLLDDPERVKHFQTMKKTIRERFGRHSDSIVDIIIDAYDAQRGDAFQDRPLAVKADRIDTSEPCYDNTGLLTQHNLETYLKLEGIKVRYNVITHKTEYSGFHSSINAEYINENITAILFDKLQHDFKKVTTTLINQNLNYVATQNAYNPILEILSTAQWDGTERLNSVYKMFGIGEDDKLSRTLMLKWFMQCICGLHNSITNPFSLDIVLVFQGAQGIGKTRFFEHLTMDEKLFGGGVGIDTRNKDTLIKSTSKWISELGEIGTTMQTDINALKSFLTSSTDEYRKPYGHTTVEYARMTSFCGTTNDEKFLVDRTGNRRFATIHLQSDLDIDYSSQIEPFNSLQFWKEIEMITEKRMKDEHKTYASVFRLTREELKALNERNRDFEKSLRGEEEVEDILANLLNNQNIVGRVEFQYITVTDFIQQHTELRGLSSRQVGKVLEKLGFPAIKKKIKGTTIRVRNLPVRVIDSVYDKAQ